MENLLKSYQKNIGIVLVDKFTENTLGGYTFYKQSSHQILMQEVLSTTYLASPCGIDRTRVCALLHQWALHRSAKSIAETNWKQTSDCEYISARPLAWRFDNAVMSHILLVYVEKERSHLQ